MSAESPLSQFRSPMIVVLSVITLWLGDGCAGAETAVSGTPDAVTVKAVGAPLAEVLSQLGAVNLRYEGAAIPARTVSGTYSGSLSQVLARLLDGTSYVTQRNGNLTVLKIINADSGRANAAVAPALPQLGTVPASAGERRSLIPESEL